MSDADFETKKSSGLKYVGIGCLAVLGIGIIAVIIGGVVVSKNWRGWVAAPARQAVSEMLDEANLPDEQKIAILVEMNSFIDTFEAGDITLEELGQVAEALAEGPILPMLAVYGLDEGYISDSGLSDEEKADASLQLRRVARGITDRTIPPNDFNNILDPLEPDPGEEAGPKVNADTMNIVIAKPEDVDDDELREFIANAKAAADEAGVPDEDFTIDYATEFRKAIEEALGRELPKDGP